MQTTEINGFQIEQFNQYDLPTGKPEGTCPVCSEHRKPENKKAKCASYDWERGLGTCHHCSNTFQLHTYQRKGNAEKVYIKPEPIQPKEVSTKVQEWFQTRGISNDTLNALKVTEGVEYMPQTSKEENAIHFNYFMGDELINVKYRDGRKNFKLYKGAEKVFYNINSIVGYEYCVIVEGEMDALSLHEAGIPNVVSVPNGATLGTNNLDYLDNCIDYFTDKEKVILALDGDEAGQALQNEFIRRLGAEVCFIATFDDCKDSNEYLLKHGKENLAERIAYAKPVPLEGVTTFKDIEGEITDFVTNGFKRKVWQGMPTKEDIGTSKWNQVAEHCNSNFYHIDMDRYSLEGVLRKGAELVKRKGIKCLIIDPFNKVRDYDGNSGDVNAYTLEYLTKIEIFAKKYDVLVIVVAHPTKMYKDANGKIEEPTMYNIKGGGEWYDASYHGLLVHRDYENKTVKCKVLKVKFQNLGENGAEAHFKWEHKSGCFLPIRDPSQSVAGSDKMPWDM